MRDLGRCRTAALGGHLQRCGDCGHERPAYNSCRNRHCPKCQALARAAWLRARGGAAVAGGVSPRRLHLTSGRWPRWQRTQPALVYEALLQTAAATLREVAANPKHLGAQVGVLMVLHTWGQTLQHHPHVHCVVTGGGLACNARGEVEQEPRWRACRPGFFLPVRVLSRLFRGKFLAWLRQAFDAGQLTGWTDAAAFRRWLSAALTAGLGGVRQAALWRAGAGAEVSGALHASGGHQQPPPGQTGGRPGDVPLPGLRRRQAASRR